MRWNNLLKRLFAPAKPTMPIRRNKIRPQLESLEDRVTPTTHLNIAATDAIKPEGNSGTTPFTFTVHRTGTAIALTVDYAVTGSGANAANAADLGGTLPSGTVTFNPTDTTKTITVNVSGDPIVEPNEGFTVTLSSPTGGAVLGTATATGAINNDDTSN